MNCSFRSVSVSWFCTPFDLGNVSVTDVFVRITCVCVYMGGCAYGCSESMWFPVHVLTLTGSSHHAALAERG